MLENLVEEGWKIVLDNLVGEGWRIVLEKVLGTLVEKDWRMLENLDREGV